MFDNTNDQKQNPPNPIQTREKKSIQKIKADASAVERLQKEIIKLEKILETKKNKLDTLLVSLDAIL